MIIHIVTPTESGFAIGNHVTGSRWQSILRSLGHQVLLNPPSDSPPPDLLIAIHAERSFQQLKSFKAAYPNRPTAVCLAGTDYNLDLQGIRGQENQSRTIWSLENADILIGLHEHVPDLLPDRFRSKTRAILQSAEADETLVRRNPFENFNNRSFNILFVGNLRQIKNPFLGAEAVDLLPQESKAKLTMIGGTIEQDQEAIARSFNESSNRTEWLGAKPHCEVRSWIGQSDLLLITSRAEGAPNIVSEACVLETAIISTRISGVEGLLGRDYPGFLDRPDAKDLSRLLWRFETEAMYRTSLLDSIKKSKDKFFLETETQRWEAILDEIF